MENNKDIDDFFKDIVDPNEMEHSDYVWASLENHLDKKTRERDKAVIFQLRLAIILLLFLFGSLTSYFVLNQGISSEKSLAVRSEDKSQNNKSLPQIKESDSKLKQNAIKSSLHQVESTVPVTSENSTEGNPLNLKSNSEKDNFTFKNKQNKTKGSRKFPKESNGIVRANDVQKSILSSKGILEDIGSKESNTKNDVNAKVITSGVVAVDSIFSGIDTTKTDRSVVQSTPSFSKEILDSIQKHRLKNRFSVMAYFSPDITKKYLKDNNNTDNQSEGDYNNSEVPDFSYNTGLLVGYDVSKNWTIKFGGSYAYLAQTIKPKVVYAKTGSDGLVHYQFNTSYGTTELPRDQTPVPAIGDSTNIKTNSTQSLQMITIPLIAKYKVSWKKFNFYTQAGISLNFLISEKLIIEDQNNIRTIKSIEGLNEYYYGGILGVGIAFNPTKKFSILFEPTIKGAITPINKNSPVTTRPISYGLAIGLGWHF